MYNKVLQLVDQYKSSYQPRPTRSGRGGVAFAQKGKAGSTHPNPSPPLEALAGTLAEQKPHPVLGEKDASGKMLANASGKKNCFNCGGEDHWVINCPALTAVQCKELAGIVHISIRGENILDRIGFLQNKSKNPKVVALRKTLNHHHRLYLDITSSFHQIFTEQHLDHLKFAGVTLRTDCNAGNKFMTKKGWYKDLFHLWLVCYGIANVLSLPQLEEDGFLSAIVLAGNGS
jgi:hypothetical protein